MISVFSACAVIPPPEVDRVTIKSGQYRIDPDHTTVLFKVSHLNLSTFIGRFNEVDATLDFSAENVTASSLNAAVDTLSLDVNNPSLEKRLQKKNWFNSGQYPQAYFKSTRVVELGPNTFQFSGDLTFRGITRPIVLEGTFHGAAINILSGRYTLGFSALGQLSRSQFEMDDYSNLIGDTVEIEIYAEFFRQ